MRKKKFQFKNIEMGDPLFPRGMERKKEKKEAHEIDPGRSKKKQTEKKERKNTGFDGYEYKNTQPNSATLLKF